MNNLTRSIIFRLVALALAIIILISPQIALAAVTSQSLAVPLYTQPDSGTLWNDVATASGSVVPFVVANPYEGPGAAPETSYTTAITRNANSGIRTLGYIQTNYQARPFMDAYKDIDRWYSQYPGIRGIFIDLIREKSGAEVCYTAALYNHVKNIRPNDLVVLGAGNHISDTYEPYGDIFLNALSDYASYQSWSAQHRGFEDKPSYQNRFWHIVHGVSSQDYQSAFDAVRANNAGWAYITDQAVPTPFAAPPAYWQNETSDVSVLPASSIPNRGRTALPRGCISLSASAENTVDTTVARQSTTKSAITVNNISSQYDSDPLTQIRFLEVPAGATVSGLSGEGWTCKTDGPSPTCAYNGVLLASTSSKLAATLEAGCQFGGGEIVVRLTNYTGNQWDVKIPLRPPVGCDPATPAGRSNTDTRGQLTSITTQSTETTPEIIPLGGKENVAPQKDTLQKKGLSPLKIGLILVFGLLLLGVLTLVGLYIQQHRRYKIRL